MKFRVLTETEFTNFAENHPQASFYQTVNWGKLKQVNGWKPHLLGVEKDNKIIAATLMLGKMTPIKKNMFYAPRGFLIDYNDKGLLDFFTKEIKSYAKKHKGIFIKIDPYLDYQQRDLLGNIVEDGINNKEAFNNLIEVGYKHFGFNIYQETLQPRWMFTVTTKNKSDDELMKGMEYETRRIIRKNERTCLIPREISYDELKLFKDIMEHTSERREFIDRPLSYYQEMFKHLSNDGKMKIMIVELHNDLLLKSLQDELNNYQRDYDDRKYKHDNKIIQMNENKYIQKQKEIENNINRLNKKLIEVEALRKEKGDIIPLGGAMFLLYGKEVLALFGGSYKEYMEYQSSYTTYWEMMKYAAKNGFERYNFYGITGDFSDTNPLIGLYTFKKDFGGQVVELLGEFDLIIDPIGFRLYNLAFTALHTMKKVKQKIKKS